MVTKCSLNINANIIRRTQSTLSPTLSRIFSTIDPFRTFHYPYMNPLPSLIGWVAKINVILTVMYKKRIETEYRKLVFQTKGYF